MDKEGINKVSKQDCAMRERAETIFARRAAQARTEAEGFEKLAEIARNADPATEEVLWKLTWGLSR